MTTRRTARGFTLIELLVVIAIIAILAAILFPVFAQAREKARSIQCLSNMKQIGTGLMMYMQDYDEMYPLAEYGGGNAGPQITWYAMIFPYTKNGDRPNSTGQSWGREGVYVCPSYPDKKQSSIYGVHQDIFVSNWAGGRNAATPASVVTETGDKIIIMEKGRNDTEWWNWLYFGAWQWDWHGGVRDWSKPGKVIDPARDGSSIANRKDCDYTNNTGPTWAGCGMMPRYRHSGMTNVIFADGHAKAMAKGQIKWGKNIWVEGIPRWPYTESWYPY